MENLVSSLPIVMLLIAAGLLVAGLHRGPEPSLTHLGRGLVAFAAAAGLTFLCGQGTVLQPFVVAAVAGGAAVAYALRAYSSSPLPSLRDHRRA
jgi:hypothetical protein